MTKDDGVITILFLKTLGRLGLNENGFGHPRTIDTVYKWLRIWWGT